MSERSSKQRDARATFAIVGMAARLPRAGDVREFWRNIINKLDCVGPIAAERRADCESYLGDAAHTYIEQGYLDDISSFDPSFFGLSDKAAELTDPRQRLFLETAFRAFEDAGMTRRNLAGSRTAVFLACNGDRDYLRLIERHRPRSAAAAIPLNSVPMIASRVSHVFDLTGPAIVIDTECSSSLVALHHACQSIAAGDCDRAVVGAVDLNFFPIAEVPTLGIESSDGRTRAFDARANGTGNGEGVFAIVVEPLTTALASSAHVYGVVRGSAVNNDGRCPVMTTPSATAQAAVILDAWRRSNVDPETIDYIEAHGTGTPIGDPIEIAGLTRAFAAHTNRRQCCAVSSVKTNIGHLNHAAGLASLVKATLALEAGIIPPSLHFERPNRQIDFESSAVYVATAAASWERQGGRQRTCGVSSFGLSGTNCHVVLGEAPALPARPRHTAGTFVFVLSAPTDALLRQRIDAGLALWRDADHDIADLCYTGAVRRDQYASRIAIVARSLQEIIERLNVPFDHVRRLMADVSSPEALRREALRFLAGEDVDWAGHYAGLDVRLVPFPPVPLTRRRCWFAEPASNSISVVPAVIDTAVRLDVRGVSVTGRSTDEYSALEVAIARLWSEVLDLEEVDVTAEFHELGADSMSFLEIVVRIEKELGVSFQDDFLEFDAFANFQQLVDYVERLTADRDRNANLR